MSTGAIIGLCLGIGIPVSLIIGALLGFFLGQKYFKKQIDENPPISREQIKNMYAAMGQKPSEQKINEIMAAAKRQGK